MRDPYNFLSNRRLYFINVGEAGIFGVGGLLFRSASGIFGETDTFQRLQSGTNLTPQFGVQTEKSCYDSGAVCKGSTGCGFVKLRDLQGFLLLRKVRSRLRACSSAGEHYVDIVGVAGSIPATRLTETTKNLPIRQALSSTPPLQIHS